MQGVLFFGTGKNKNSSDFSGVYEWQQFDVPSVKSIVELRNMIEYDREKFKNDFGIQKGICFFDFIYVYSTCEMSLT